jgi:hypothetical protein
LCKKEKKDVSWYPPPQDLPAAERKVQIMPAIIGPFFGEIG